MVTAVSKTEKGKVSVQRARLLKAQADRAELNLRRERGELIARADMDAAAFNFGRSVRDAMQNIPARIDSIVAAESDVHVVRAILDAEIRNALIDFCDLNCPGNPNPNP